MGWCYGLVLWTGVMDRYGLILRNESLLNDEDLSMMSS